MKKATQKARKVLSVFLSVLMILTTLTVAVPGLALAAEGEKKYYVKVYVNIYDGSDGYGGAYTVEESTGKPANYSWATNAGWYGRINMTGFTVFGEKGDFSAQDISDKLKEFENDSNYYAMSNLKEKNDDGSWATKDWDDKAIGQFVRTFELTSFPVEIFWMNDENNWDGGNTGFAIRKLTVATSADGDEHTMWEGLAGSDSETYNYYGSITPTGIHTCFEDYAKNYDMDDYKFYKAITTSSQRAWSDPHNYGSTDTFYLNEYANGGVSATFSEGLESVATTVDYIDTSSSDTYYVNYTNHSKTQTATIKGTFNNGNFVTSPVGVSILPGETRSYEINKTKYGSLAKDNDTDTANFTFTYTLSNVYESDALNAPLATFTQPAYIGLWNDISNSKAGTTFSLNNIKNLQITFQTTEGILETVTTPSEKVDHATVEYRYYIDNSIADCNWEKTGLRFYMTETNSSRVHFQNKNKTAGTMSFSGPITNTGDASLKMADFAFSNITEAFAYNVSAAATYGNTVTPTWEPKEADAFATFWNNKPAWVRFGGTTFEIDPEAENQYATISMKDMLFNDYYNYQAKFTATINVYAVNKGELRNYIRETLLNFAPMNLRYDSTAFTNYQNALATAMNVLANQKTTQYAVNQAYTSLKSAVDALLSTDNLINQVDELTHIQYKNGIGSEVVASTDARYVLVPLGEHTVPQKTDYASATNKNSALITDHDKTDTKINIINYHYWNIDYSAIDGKIAEIDAAIVSVVEDLASENPTYKNSYKTYLENAKADLEAMKTTINVVNTPTSQEDVDSLIEAANSLLNHNSDALKGDTKYYANCVYDGSDADDKDDIVDSKINSCTEGGYYKATCIICGKVATVTETSPTGHDCDYGTIPTNDPVEGKHYWVCAICGENEYFDHNWNAGVETQAPGCGTEGVTTYTCNDCGATKTEAIEAGKHIFVITDNKDGTHISKCTECHADKEGAVAEAHTYSYTDNKDGTHTAECDLCDFEETASHTFANPVLVRPTLVDGNWVDGTWTYSCVCGETKTEPAVRADYSELEEVVDALEELKDNENLTDEAKEAINAAIQKADNLADNLVTAEQKQIDDLVKELQKVKADADEAIKNKEIGVEKITEATSGVKVQFIDESGLGAIDSIQLGKDNGFIIRVANGNADSDITIKSLNGSDVNKTLGSGKSTDLNIDATGLTAGIATYTITYTIDGLKDADGNPVVFTTKAYLYVKAAAYQPYHLMDEDCANGSATSEWAYSLEASVGDFALVYNYKAPKDEFGNDNLKRDKALALSNFTYYDYENDNCYAGCSDSEWKKGDAHAATYRYYIDTSLAATWREAGLTAVFAETDKSNYDNAAIEYIRLANNEAYLNAIKGTDKTFSVTFKPGASSNVPNMTWSLSSAGDMTVSEYINPDQNNYLFGQKLVDDGKKLNTAYANFSGEIPSATTDAKLMFSPRLVYKKAAEGFLGIQGAQNEAITMTTHLYITSYDKGALRTAVANAEQAGFNSEYFDGKKYEAYENALAAAKEVLGKAETNQNQVDDATAALNAAIANLENAEAKFVLTVTHSIYNGKDKSGEASETLKDYYLANGDVTPAYTNLVGKTINKYDDKATIPVTEDKAHTYNYWYIDYSKVQEALNKADAIINDTTSGYTDEYKEKVETAKKALEEINKTNSNDSTTTPELQSTVDNAINAVTDLTGHTHLWSTKYYSNGNGVESTHYQICTTCGIKNTAVKHTWSKGYQSAEPTCTEMGKWTYTCQAHECGATYTVDSGTPNGHSWDKETENFVADTSVENKVGYYSYGCSVENCDGVLKIYVEAADYNELNSVVTELQDIIINNPDLTDEAKKKITDAIAEAEALPDGLTKTATEEGVKTPDGQSKIDAVVEKLEGIKTEVKEGIENKTLLYVDLSAYNAALEIYNNTTVDFATDTDKTTAQNAINSLAGITAESSKANGNQDKIDAATTVLEGLNEKYKNCAADKHSDADNDKDHNCDICGEKDITAHDYADATCEAPKTCKECGATDGTPNGHTWNTTGTFTADTSVENKVGYYSYGCSVENCDGELKIYVEAADYNELNSVVTELQDIIIKNPDLTDEAKKKITDAIAEAEALPDGLTKTATEEGVKTPDGQSEIDVVVEKLESIKTEVKEGIENKTLLYVDLSAYNTALEIYTNSTSKVAKAEDKAKVEAAVKTVTDAEITATTTKAAGQKTLDDAAAVIAAINAKYSKCAVDTHTYERDGSKVETEPTCTADGYTTYHCDICGNYKVITDEGSAIAHKNKVRHEAVTATCIAGGNIEYWSCPDCGKNYSDKDCTVAVENVYTEINADNHNLVSVAAKAPTCTEDGYKAYKYCDRDREFCDYTTYELDPKTGHNYDKNNDGKVTRADAAYTAPVKNGDTWSDAVYTYTCQNNCDESYTETVARADYEAYDKAVEDLNKLLEDTTLTETAKNKIKEALETNKKADNLDADSQQEVTDAANALNGVLAEITGENKDKYTKVDLSAYNTALEIYNNTTVDFATDTDKTTAQNAINSLAGITAESSKANGNQNKINAATTVLEGLNEKYKNCAKKQHDYESTTTQPTCTDRGYTTHICKVCGNGYTDSFTGPNGHAWSKWELTLAPTKDTDGTYTRTCSKGDATETKSVARESYEAYDAAVKRAESMAEDSKYTPEAIKEIKAALEEAKKLNQNLPADVIEDGETVINNDSAEQIKSATDALTGVLDKITDDTTGAYEKVDYTNYNNAVNAYEALDDVMTDKDKADVEAEKQKVVDAGITANTSKADGQKTLDDAAKAIAAINAKYGDCANGNHTWGEPVLTTAPTADKQGEYTETCGICGTTQITKVDLADYSEFNTVAGQLEALLDTKNLTESAKTAINEALEKADNLNKNLPADVTTADGKLIKGGQETINKLVEELNKVVADTNAAITDGSALEPDYEAWEEAKGAYDALDKKNVKSEIIAEAETLKETIADKQLDDTLTQATATQARINEATARLNEIIDGITDGSLKNPDYSGAEAAIQNAKDVADNENIPDTKEAEIEAEIAELEKELADLRDKNPDSNNQEAKDKLAEIEQAANDIVNKYAECVAGTHKDTDPKDHKCDICGGNVGTHADSNNDHKCDYCEDVMTECTDIGKDHECDICGGNVGTHADGDKDHKCDYCEAVMTECTDIGKDHKCDICGGNVGTHADGNNDHKCDYCDDVMTECTDSGKDHKCDICGGNVGTHADGDNDHKCDYCEENISSHTWGDHELTTPPTADAQGEYTETCGVCGTTQITKVDLADYSEFNTVEGQLEALLGTENLTDEAKTAINEALEKAEALDKNLPADATTADGKLIKGGQDEIDALVNELKDVVADTSAAIADGSALKPDYEAWETAKDAYGKLDTTNVKAEIIAEVNGLKAEIADKQADDALTQATATQKDIDNATKRLNEIITGITDGSLKNPADYTEVDKDLADAKDKADKNDVVDGVKEDIKEIEDKLNEFRNDPTTNADDQDEIDALDKELKDIIAGIEGGTLVKPDYSGAEAAIKEAEKVAEQGGKLSEEDQKALEELRDDLDKIKNDPASNKKDDQRDVDDIKNAVQNIVNKYSGCTSGNHSYIDKVVAPSCTSKGYTEHSCEICGKTFKDNYTDITDHKYSVVSVVDPTCTAKGYTNYACDDCGKAIKGDYVEALNHTAMDVKGYDATCSAEGLTDGKVCIRCNEVLVAQKVISKLPHTDEDEDGTCDICHQGGLYDGCTCLCHNNHWFWRLVYLILRLIWRVFKIHPVCACGAVHYR